MRHLTAAALLVATLALGGCSNSATSPTTTTTTTTTTTATTTVPTVSTELFAGTLSPKDSQFYSFSVNTAGPVSITLASTSTARIGPPVSARLTVGLGTPLGFGCSTLSSVDATPGLTAQLSSASSGVGIYCVNVSDPGGLSGAVNFVVRIIHS